MGATNKTFSSSHFKRVYNQPEVKKVTEYGFLAHGAVHELFEKVIPAYFGVPVAKSVEYCARIHTHVVEAGGTSEYLNKSNLYAARLWTTQDQLCGREFSSYLNEMIRKDDLPSDQMVTLAKVCRVINA